MQTMEASIKYRQTTVNLVYKQNEKSFAQLLFWNQGYLPQKLSLNAKVSGSAVNCLLSTI